MNEENPSTDATFDRLLDELHGIQSGQSYAAALEWTSRLRAGLDALESLAVRDAVLNAHLSKTEIASALGITRQTLYNRHKELFGELKEQCRRVSGIPSIRPHTGYATDGPYPPRRRNDGQSRNRTPVRHDHGCPPRPHDTHVAARQGPSRHPHMGAVHL